ncbi:SRPBCC family protein [Amycolatopsis sp. NBC_01480]|uniref:SRPBCC family protein n=1 Tax=Amycolatopsis sp. NBC_01480 TaxID=2903562 RepID=UPI002E2DC341|nr:SRPBCC family protein [Amycolatopsis sp. NBC_01480]
MNSSDATGHIDVAVSPAQVYALVSDPAQLAGIAAEYQGHRWLDGARASAVGARWRGTNRNGLFRWNTTSTVTAADEARRFAFDVAFGPVPVARWEYAIEPTPTGCTVTERTYDRRPAWFRRLSVLGTGVRDRKSANELNIAETLIRLKATVEA